MVEHRRVNMKAILANADLRRELMVSTIQATQAREGIETTREQADRAYYVVTEAENVAFFDLERFMGHGRSEPDRREDMFAMALRNDVSSVRFDVARRDFGAIETSPLAYRRVGVVAHIFRDAPALEPAWGIARQGKATAGDSEWIRHHWEVRDRAGWVPFAKGGEFSRFYADVHLVIDWRAERRDALKAVGNGLPSLEHYFRPGLTWPRAGGSFSLRMLPLGCVFADKGPVVFPNSEDDTHFLLGVANSAVAEYIMQSLTSRGKMGGRWGVGIVKRLPIPRPSTKQKRQIYNCVESVFQMKRDWDDGNETSTRFVHPWMLRVVHANFDVPSRLTRLCQQEELEETCIQSLYAELNDAVYRLYNIADTTRLVIEEAMGERPSEILWPEMGRKDGDQKRMEHVWRLLSYVVKRVVEADDDGIVPFIAVGGEGRLIDRVRNELDALFPNHDLNQVEVAITNELKRRVKGYRHVETLEEWLRDEFFAYHTSMYKQRPIFWHIASSQGRGEQAFGAIVHYHKFDHDRLAKFRGTYLRDVIVYFRREAGLAVQEGRTEDRFLW